MIMGVAMARGRVIKYSHTIGMQTNFGPGFYYPYDAALGRDDTLFVLSRGVDPDNSSGRITLCTVEEEEEYLGEISEIGTGNGQIMWPVSGAFDQDGNIYVSDDALHRISIFDQEGQFLAKWGVKGSGEGEFDGPTGIAFDRDNNLLVVDSLNSRIQRYTSDGLYLGGWGGPGSREGELDMPWGIAVDKAGDDAPIDVKPPVRPSQQSSVGQRRLRERHSV